MRGRRRSGNTSLTRAIFPLTVGGCVLSHIVKGFLAPFTGTHQGVLHQTLLHTTSSAFLSPRSACCLAAANNNNINDNNNNDGNLDDFMLEFVKRPASQPLRRMERMTSLAGQYLVEIITSPSTEEWSLIPLNDVYGVTDAMPEGTRSMSALKPRPVANNPVLVLECTLDTSEAKALKVILLKNDMKGNGEADEGYSLIALLSRILIQNFVARQEEENDHDWTIRLPFEYKKTLKNMQSEDGAAELFAPILQSHSIEEVEMIEMVNRNGRALGMVPRPLVHLHNLLHRGVGLVVTKDVPFDQSGLPMAEFPDLYMHRRTDTKRIFPSLYDMFVGGISLANEDSKVTAVRELSEELGLGNQGSTSEALSDALFDCTVCTAYNRCVVTLFCYCCKASRPSLPPSSSEEETETETIVWQDEEVAWGSFVPYKVIQAAAHKSIERLIISNKWPGTYPQYNHASSVDVVSDGLYTGDGDGGNWWEWDFVPDGLLVWEAWTKWQAQQQQKKQGDPNE